MSDQPEPPRDVVLRLSDGRTVPVDLEYFGVMTDEHTGKQSYLWLSHDVFDVEHIRETLAALEIGVLPPHTSVALRTTKPRDADD